MGAITTQTVRGKTYLLTFTNGGTSHQEVFLLADKHAKTTEAFKQYHKMA